MESFTASLGLSLDVNTYLTINITLHKMQRIIEIPYSVFVFSMWCLLESTLTGSIATSSTEKLTLVRLQAKR